MMDPALAIGLLVADADLDVVLAKHGPAWVSGGLGV